MQYYLLAFVVSCILSPWGALLSPLCAAEGWSNLNQSLEPNLVINNRVLANVNNNTLTVNDLAKKLDVLLHRQFPDKKDLVQFRYQFYQANWRLVLNDLIDRELILADAKEKKFEVSEGEVREEIETMFGPDVVATLDSLNLPYEEAFEMVHKDITVRRMLLYKVHLKVNQQITPKKLKLAYDDFIKARPDSHTWRYRVISVKHADDTKAKASADVLAKWLKSGMSFEEVQEEVAKIENHSKEIKFSISDLYEMEESQISPNYLKALSQLEPGSSSLPQEANNKTPMYRIFYLDSIVPTPGPSFNEVAANLRDKLSSEATDLETKSYLSQLRSHFGLDDHKLKEMVPENFQPFSLY